jgi:hypothetical protein
VPTPAAAVPDRPDATTGADAPLGEPFLAPAEGPPHLPPSANLPEPVGEQVERKGVDIEAGGYLLADFVWSRDDGGTDTTTFSPRQIELDVDVAYADVGRLHTELNLFIDTLAADFDTLGFDRLLADRIIEQAFLEWTPGLGWGPRELLLRFGKMPAPVGAEPLDVADRLELSRGSLNTWANPDLITGLLLQARIIEWVDLYMAWFNGWDATVDGNAAKSFTAGVPHRLGARGDDTWWYEGQVDVVVGVEDPSSEDNLRWIVDYSFTVRTFDWLSVKGEVLYGEEQRAGRDAAGAPDRDASAQFWGALGIVRVEPTEWPVAGSVRVEAVGDPDLLLGLPPTGPTLGFAPTTQMDVSLNLRYIIAEPLQVGFEYRLDLQRRDIQTVEQVLVNRGWVGAHQVMVAAIGKI